jgi:hypothetical protein
MLYVDVFRSTKACLYKKSVFETVTNQKIISAFLFLCLIPATISVYFAAASDIVYPVGNAGSIHLKNGSVVECDDCFWLMSHEDYIHCNQGAVLKEIPIAEVNISKTFGEAVAKEFEKKKNFFEKNYRETKKKLEKAKKSATRIEHEPAPVTPEEPIAKEDKPRPVKKRTASRTRAKPKRIADNTAKKEESKKEKTTSASGKVSGGDIPLTHLVKKIQPAVVTVIAYRKKNTISGSGFFIDKEGHLITNRHLFNAVTRAEVRTSDGKTYKIKRALSQNKEADLIRVLVDIPEESVHWISVIEKAPEIAERIFVLGSPLGFEKTVTEGIVSAIREMENEIDVYQISAPISPGSSGSPVINMRGDVIGVATFVCIEGQNLNFAVPGKYVVAEKQKRQATTIRLFGLKHKKHIWRFKKIN